MNYHEKELVYNFIIKRKRDRYLQFLNNPKNRRKFLRELGHFKDFKDNSIIYIPKNQQNEDEIVKRLIKLGSNKECYIISEDSNIDATYMPLILAIKHVLGTGMGTIISCIPGKLAYYEGEDERLILKTPKLQNNKSKVYYNK